MRHLLASLSTALSCLMFCAPAFAQDMVSVAIAPLGSTLLQEEGEKALQEVFTVTNTGSGTATFEVQAFAWDQGPKGEMLLTPTEDFLVYPKVVSVATSKSRAIRLVYRGPKAPEGKQLYYRLQLREVPRKFKTDTGEEVQVALATRILLPLVIQQKNFNSPQALAFEATPEGLRAVNKGSSLAKVSAVMCKDEQVSGLLYVMPGKKALLENKTCQGPLTVIRENQENESVAISSAP